jgi:hypothetical protein
LLVLDLFRWLISSWFNFVWLYASRNLSISFRFFSLFDYKFSMYSLMILWILLVSVVMPFLSIILLIWVFSLLCFVMLAKDFSILLIFSKNQVFVSLIAYIGFFLVSNSLISALIFIISLRLLVWGLVYSCFSRSLRYIIRFIWEVSVFFKADQRP